MNTDLPSWMKSLGRPRAKKLRLPQAPSAPAELEAWHSLLQARAVEKALSGVRIYRDFARSGSDVLTRREALVAKLTATHPLAHEPGGHLEAAVSLAPSKSGKAAVFEWSDEDEPGISRSAGSIELWLHDSLSNEEDASRIEDVPRPSDPKEKLPSHWDPAVLLKRSRWLLVALEMDPWNDQELEELLKHAPDSKLLRTEARLLDQCPHLAAYWLWALFLLHEEDLLKVQVRALKKHADPFVRESAAAFGIVLAGGELPRPLGPYDESTLAELRETVLAAAPKRLLSSEVKANLQSGAQKPAGKTSAKLEFARKWMKRQSGDLDHDRFLEALEEDTPEVRDFVVDALKVCTHPDPVDSLALLALKYKLKAAVPSLRRLISGRIGFSEDGYGYQANFGAVRAVRALAALEGAAALPFLQAEWEKAKKAKTPSPHDRHHSAALVAGVLALDPASKPALAAARSILEEEIRYFRDKHAWSMFSEINMAAILWAVEHAKISALRKDLLPFVTFRVPPNRRDEAQFAIMLQEWAAGMEK